MTNSKNKPVAELTDTMNSNTFENQTDQTSSTEEINESMNLDNLGEFDLSEQEPEPDFMDSFEMTLDELDDLTSSRIVNTGTPAKSSKKASEAWLEAKKKFLLISSDEAESIRTRYAQIHKAFKKYGKDKFNLVINGCRISIVADHKSFRSIERVLRELTFKNTIDGVDYHVLFEDAVNLHEHNVTHAGRKAKSVITKPEYFIITEAVPKAM